MILEAFIELELETRSTGKSRRPLEQVILSSGGREKKAIIHSTIKLLGKRYLSKEPSYDAPEWWKEDASAISAVAAFLAHLFNDWGIIDSWLTSLSGAGVGEPVGIRRAVVAVATTDGKSNIETVLEDCLKLFGDSLYIRHTPTLQQDGEFGVGNCMRTTLIRCSSCPGTAPSSRMCAPDEPSQAENAFKVGFVS